MQEVDKSLRRPVVGLTLGDAAGIGPEIVVRAAASGSLTKDVIPVLIGSERSVKRGMETTGASFGYWKITELTQATEAGVIYLLDTRGPDCKPAEFGKISIDCGRDSAEDVVFAAKGCMAGALDGFCFAPTNKTAIKRAGYEIGGMVDLLCLAFDYTGDCGELNIVDNAFNARVTGHIPVSAITSRLTTPLILKTIRMTHAALKRYGLEHPRLAVAALNPHGGENGTCGDEEITIIAPAVKQANEEGIAATGPLPADTLFVHLFDGLYDAAITMFHDQGQIAFKLKGFDRGVTAYGGIPYPVTTCAHGTAFDIAGKGIASEAPLLEAFRIVSKMCMNRA